MRISNPEYINNDLINNINEEKIDILEKKTLIY